MQIDHRLFSEIENELKVISVFLLILQKYTCPGGAADVGLLNQLYFLAAKAAL